MKIKYLINIESVFNKNGYCSVDKLFTDLYDVMLIKERI